MVLDRRRLRAPDGAVGTLGLPTSGCVQPCPKTCDFRLTSVPPCPILAVHERTPDSSPVTGGHGAMFVE
jgi:hypothetical protein